MHTPSIIAVVPAKSISRRISRKNMRTILGVSLWQWAAKACDESGVFESIFISSDVHLQHNRSIFHRRDCVRDCPATDVARDVFTEFWGKKWDRPEWVCLVQPTSPCLRSETLRNAAQLCGEDVDAVIAYAAGSKRFPCGAFYFLRSHVLEQTVELLDTLKVLEDTHRVVWYPLPSDEAIDVDCVADLKLAGLILEDRNRANHS